MVVHWPLIGRREELSIIERTLGGDQYRGLLLAGAPGVGKTRLAREALGTAEAVGCETKWAVASPAVATIPFGAVAHLLPPAEEKSTHLHLLQQTGQWLAERARGRRVGRRAALCPPPEIARHCADATELLRLHDRPGSPP